nr:transposase [Salinibacter ruber]
MRAASAVSVFDDVRGATLSTLVSLFDHRIDQAGGPDATQFKQKDSLLVEPLPQDFLDRFADRFSESLNVLVLDNGRFHKAKSLTIPDNIRLIFLPPYSPELNPVERLWQDLKDHLAFHLYENLSALRQRVRERLETYTDEAVASLTGYEYLLNAASA